MTHNALDADPPPRAHVDGGLRGYLDACVHELVERQAQRTPAATAVVGEGMSLTYRTLNTRANRLAGELSTRGAGPERLVGICMETCLDAVVAVLAILKTGAGCVSLAVDQPVQRLRDIVEATGLQFVVTCASCAARLDASGAAWVSADGAADGTAQDAENPRSGVSLDNVAFVRYTSGSTGRPKGVVNTHRSVISRLVSVPLPDIREHDVCGFNMSLGLGTRLFYPLVLGGTLAVIRDDEIRDAAQLSRAIEEKHVSSMYMVPSLLRQLLSLDGSARERLRGIRVITTGGDALTAPVIERFADVMPQALLINAFGSSEIGTTAAMRPVTEDSDIDWRSIGRPVANTSIYVLDESMCPLPCGVAGEIYVASPHLARGYLGRTDLTAQRFLPDPFSSRAGARMYRTGDLGRYAPAGDIEFLGRADHQVKVRGFRVELGEIEAVLLDSRHVHAAAVTVRQMDQETQLVAYVVPKPSEEISVTDVRGYLQQRLPHYMIPAVIIVLDGMPLTPTGKVDRRALPAPELTRPPLATPYSPPRDSTEAALARIWASALGLGSIGIHDNFLELGGDSLIATQVNTQMCERFGVELTLAALLEHPTVAKAASYITSALATLHDAEAGAR